MKKLLITTMTALLLSAVPALATPWTIDRGDGVHIPNDKCWSDKCHATSDPDGKPKPQEPEHRDPRDNTPTPAYSFLCKDQQDQTVYHTGFGHSKAQAKLEVDAKLEQLKADNKKLRNCNAEVEFFLRAAGHYNDK